MEATGGEPESPIGRRSVCYDREAPRITCKSPGVGLVGSAATGRRGGAKLSQAFALLTAVVGVVGAIVFYAARTRIGQRRLNSHGKRWVR